MKNAKNAKNAKSVKIVKTVKTAKTAKLTTDSKVQTTLESVKATKKAYVTNRVIVTRSVNNKFQQRSTGSRRLKNNWGHYEGTIGAKIDSLISKNNFTKKQIMAFAGTKMSKVNSHINHLRKEKLFAVDVNKATKIVSFAKSA